METVLKNRPIDVAQKDFPGYTKGGEIFNAVTHICGGAAAVVILILGVVFAALYNDVYAVVSMAVYGVSMILVYTMSSIYHFLRPNRAKKLFRVLDHCMIYLLIAGTYTPVCLITLRASGAWGWTLFGIIWFFAILGVTLNAVKMHNKAVKIFSHIAYLAMGWSVVAAIVPMLSAMPLPGILLLLAGGIAYTAGVVFYALGRRGKYIHGVWHIFVIMGSILQFFAILFYAVLI